MIDDDGDGERRKAKTKAKMTAIERNTKAEDQKDGCGTAGSRSPAVERKHTEKKREISGLR